MRASTCSKNSAAMLRKKRQEKHIEDGNFAAAPGYTVTTDGPGVTVQIEIIFRPRCCIKRPKKKEK